MIGQADEEIGERDQFRASGNVNAADIKEPIISPNQQSWNQIRKAEGAAGPGKCVTERTHRLVTVEQTVIKLGTMERF